MRKFQMKQVEGLLQLLDEAQAEVRRFLKTEQTASALALLQQCQESAVHLGNLIEAEEGEGTAAVGLLEQYCEEIYQCYQKIERGEWENEYKIYKVLNRALIRAGNSIKKDIKVYKEMVFLPYKASMWDSMESIWRAAEKDEHTVAYVIPIPYYDRNPDGSLGAMHYEGSQYPAYVPVIQYGSYDFEARRPDAVYIHNPYDNGNFVTSVHPDFYAGRLSRLTDMLVYVPYIVHSEEVDQSICDTAGIFYADRIFVQSETVRAQYVQGILRYNPDAQLSQVQEKIVALGSPKVDKVLLGKKEAYSISPAWRDMLGPPDSPRMTVLYNLSLEFALAHTMGDGTAYLRKLQSVFAFFSQNKKATLWWRPHPLLEQTFFSIRPHIYSGYKRIVEAYKDSQIGIYDDSSNMDRAIAYADACYGDWSSLNLLMQFVGKPVLIQDIKTAGSETKAVCSKEQIDGEFISENPYNSYILYESSNGGFNLRGLIEHFDIIQSYSAEQSAKYRAKFVHADGTAGEHIYRYVDSIT